MRNIFLISATIIAVLVTLTSQSAAQIQQPPAQRQQIDLSPRPLPRPTPPAPKVTAFAINNAASKTASRTVSLNNTFLTAGGASHYRASENRNFSGSAWQPYSRAPEFKLSAGDGRKTVYFQIKNKDEAVSAIVSDTIILAELRMTNVPLGEVYNYAKGRGYTFTASANDPNSDCRVEVRPAPEGYISHMTLVTQGRAQTFGAKCTFNLFNKSLHEGWTYKFDSKEIGCDSVKGKGGCVVIERPSDGGRNITYKVRGWCDAVPPSLSERSGCTYLIYFRSIKIEGPAGKNWQEAFE
jgi:hypothetical protein